MKKADAQARIDLLRRELDHHDHCYYVLAKPEISDRDYDLQYKELENLEEMFPELITPESPTQRVGGQPIEGFQHVRHLVPMLSLDNVFYMESPDPKNKKDLRRFDHAVSKKLSGEKAQYVLEPKVDGVSVSLRYENGHLTLAATRGDVRNLGFAFYMAADIRLASNRASFTVQDLSGGILPGWGLTHILPRLIGPGRTLDLLWSRRTVGAEEAFQLGLVDRLVDDAAWEEALDAFTERLRRLPQPAVQLSKLAVQQAGNLDFTSMLSLEWESQQQCWASLETSEGLRARREGRDPELDTPLVDEED